MANYCVYRHFDANDELLYVGASMCALMRTQGHQSAALWFDKIRKITIEHFPTMRAAFLAENDIIVAEKPKHNRTALPLKPNALLDFLLDSKSIRNDSQLAKYLNCEHSTLSKIRSGKINLSKDLRKVMSAKFRISMEKIDSLTGQDK